METEYEKPLVLVVDDDPTNLRILVSKLNREYRLGVAKSGTKALEYMGKQIPDLVLLDVMMPDMDGYAVCEHIKRDPRLCDIPVVFISYVDDPSQKTRGFEVGGSDLHKPNFRIIAATNRNLAERVASGQMREDFFYRIHVIPIHLPPLRQRKEDIPLLIEYFLNAYPRVGDLPALNGEVMQAFMQYDWPGNIRELHNTLYRYLTLGKVQLGTLQVGTGQLPAGGQTGTGEAEHRQALPQEPLASALDRFEREYLLETLRRNDWKRAETADILGIDRRTLFRKIKQFDLEDEEGK